MRFPKIPHNVIIGALAILIVIAQTLMLSWQFGKLWQANAPQRVEDRLKPDRVSNRDRWALDGLFSEVSRGH